MTTLYGLKNCDTCKKASKWLDRFGVAYTFVDYRDNKPSPETLVEWAGKAGGFAALIVTRTMTGIGGLATAVACGALVYGVMLRLLNAVEPQDAAVMDRLLSRMPSQLARLPRLVFGLIVSGPAAPEAAK